MLSNQKSAADQVAEAKAKAAGIPYVKRTWDNLKDSTVENAPNKPTEPPANRELSPSDDDLTGQPEATPKASPAKNKKAVSDRKKAANKANAQNATGPRTAEGKARVSENALKHGLRSQRNPLDISTQIPGEQTQFEPLLADLTASLQPAHPAEIQLVARLAQLSLRLNRAAQMESATLGQSRTDALETAARFPGQFPDPASPDFEIAIMANTFSRASAQLKLLSQYESRLSLDFARTLRQLQQLQKTSKQTQPVLIPKGEQPTTKPIQSLASHGQVATDSEQPHHSAPPQSAPVNLEQTNPIGQSPEPQPAKAAHSIPAHPPSHAIPPNKPNYPLEGPDTPRYESESRPAQQ